MKVGIIGGRGKMGGLFAGVFARAGHEVQCSGRSGRPTNEELARASDLLVVSVPIRTTPDVIRAIAPVLREEQTICDLTSLKVAPVQAMLESSAQVVGLHPMFGPSVRGIRNQTIVATPARCSRDALDRLLSVFRAEGALITLATPEQHDRMMAVVQGLTHFATLCMADTMRREGVAIPDALAYTSPIYRIELGLVGRLLAQDAGLYADMLELNPYVPQVLASFSSAAGELRRIVGDGDPAAFAAFFRANAETYGDYGPVALQETDAIIEYLVSR
jgi:prephenate dehydrogenase